MNEDVDSQMLDLLEASAREVKTLKYWLRIEDIFTSPYVRDWLANTPETHRSDVLAKIASQAQPEPKSLLRMMINSYLMVFATSDAVRDNTPATRKVGLRAALLLSRLGDPLCLAPLVRCFELHWFWAGRYQSDTEAALIGFLDTRAADLDLRDNSSTLQRLAMQVWHSRGDLSDRLTKLLIADLECLNKIGGKDEISAIEHIAAANSKTANRKHVKELAMRLMSAVQRSGV